MQWTSPRLSPWPYWPYFSFPSRPLQTVINLPISRSIYLTRHLHSRTSADEHGYMRAKLLSPSIAGGHAKFRLLLLGFTWERIIMDAIEVYQLWYKAGPLVFFWRWLLVFESGRAHRASIRRARRIQRFRRVDFHDNVHFRCPTSSQNIRNPSTIAQMTFSPCFWRWSVTNVLLLFRQPIMVSSGAGTEGVILTSS